MTLDEARRSGLPVVTGVIAGADDDERPELPPSAWPAVTTASDGEAVAAPSPSLDAPTEDESTVRVLPAVDSELVALHERFDRIETTLRNSLTIASLHARFDRLEAWLAQHFTAEGDAP